MMIQRIAVSVLALNVMLGSVMLSPANAQLFGPSDEQKAQEAAQDSGIQELQNRLQQQGTRIQGLEDKVRALTQSLSQATGQNEELGHQIQLQNDKLDRMEKDFAYRLCTLSAQQLGANDAINCSGANSASVAAPSSGAQTLRPGDALPPVGDPEPAVRGRAPGILGSLPAGQSPGQGAVPSQPVSGNSAQYDQAMNLMSRAQYSEAQSAFRSYADTHPDDTDLSPQAIYWVGNINFIRQDYASAQRNFAEVIKKYPKSQRAADAMLKLAQSYMSLGQKSEGCTTLGAIKTRYPNGSPQTLASAATLRKTACTK
jgi:tol-pal system protein YbgF